MRRTAVDPAIEAQSNDETVPDQEEERQRLISLGVITPFQDMPAQDTTARGREGGAAGAQGVKPDGAAQSGSRRNSEVCYRA